MEVKLVIMKDPIVQEIHRQRASYAKPFNYDVYAIGEDIRRSESESKGKFVAKVRQIKRGLNRGARGNSKGKTS
jgi:hypothetical protein